MDKIEKEKHLILNWLGYKIEHIPEDEVNMYPESRTIHIIPEYDALFKDGKESIYTLDTWRPYDNDWATYKQWEEIWLKLSPTQQDDYINAICIENNIEDVGIKEFFEIHITEPHLRWKCLLEILS